MNRLSAVVLIGLAAPAHAGDMPFNYCGLYAAHAALKAAGISVPFDALCDHRYVGSYEGSTVAELELAIQDHGGYAQPMKGLTLTALRYSDHPVILHVRRLGLNTQFNHWVTYLGMDEYGKPRILDPPHGIATMEFAELNALWDGVGLVVSNAPISRQRVWCASMSEGVTALAVIVAALVFFRRCAPTARAWFALLASTSVLTSLALWSQDSFLWHPNAVGLVFGHHHKPNLPEIDYNRMAQIIRAKSHLVIDCRFAATFADGHLPGAISLPVTSSPAEQMAFLQKYPRTTPVVVYCESKDCSWSKSFGAAIYHYGFRDTAVYPGGWNDWDEHAKK